MQYVNLILNAAFNGLMFPFRGESPWPGLIAVSCAAAMFFVLVFKKFSDQKSLKRQKGRMLARALELLLFRHDMTVSFTAFGRMAIANGRYVGTLSKPIAVAIVPSILLLIQLACWYEHRPFHPGESILVSADFGESFSVMRPNVMFRSSPGLELETDGLRIPALNQINWRLRARSAEAGWIEIETDEQTVRKQVLVGTHMVRISGRRAKAGFVYELFHPSEPPLPNDQSVRQIHVQYPERRLFLGDWEVPWVLAFFVLTMGVGLLFGRLFKVTF